LYDASWVRLDFTDTTQYDQDAGDLTKGTLDPDRIGDRSVDPEKMKTNVVIASEPLAAGDLVNVWDNNGLFFVRRADASLGREAHGFVLTAAATGEQAAVFTVGYDPLLSDLAPGAQFLSTTPGRPTNGPPQEVGHTVQRVGFASDATTLHFRPGDPVRLT
jgi:hypothetical protein